MIRLLKQAPARDSAQQHSRARQHVNASGSYHICDLHFHPTLTHLSEQKQEESAALCSELMPRDFAAPLGHCLHCCTQQCTSVHCSAVPSSALQKQSLWPWGTKAQLPYALFIRKVHRVLSFSLKRSAYFTKFGTLKAKFNRRFLVFWC